MRWKKLLLCMAAIASLFSACSQDSKTQKNESVTQQEKPVTLIKLSSKAGDIEIAPKKIARIVVLDTNALSTINILSGQQKNRVVAVPKTPALPNSLTAFNDKKYKDAGHLREPNLEVVANSNPDIILMNARMLDYVNEFKKLAPTYFLDVDFSNYWESFKEQTLNIAKIINKVPEAKTKLTKLEEQIAKIKVKSKGKTALVVMLNSDKILAYGAGSRFDAIYSIYGFTPIDPDIKVAIHGMPISVEYIPQKNPDYLFVIDRDTALAENAKPNTILKNDLINKTKAAKNGNIVYLNSSVWYLLNEGLGGVQYMTNELEKIVENIVPEEEVSKADENNTQK